jgi:hypothetical protein
MRKWLARRANPLSNLKYQIFAIEVLDSPGATSQKRDWLKISGGGGTQPYSATHRISTFAHNLLASI